MVATQRPGVYSEYTASGVLWGNGKNKDVAIVATNNIAEQNHVYEIKRVSDATTIFGTNGLMVRLCSIALSNGANKIQAVSAGSGTDNEYIEAFAAVKDIDSIGVVICDSEAQSVNTILKNSVVTSSEDGKERIGIISCEESYIESFVSSINCERILALQQKAYDETDLTTASGCFLAAALAGIMVNVADPTYSFNSTALSAVNSLNESYTESELDTLLESGIAVFETVAGKIEIIRAVSTRTQTDGVDDLTFHDINTVMIIDDVVISIRNVLENMLATAKNNESTRAAISTQASIELENKKSEGLIEEYSQPDVYQDETDPSICIVELSFTVSHTLNQIDIVAYIKV